MRINLILNGTDVRGPYLNVDPFARPGDGKVPGHPCALDPIVEDAEAEEVVALDVLDFLPPSEVDDAIAHWARKLRRGGTLTVGGLDLFEVARRLRGRQIDLDRANRLIYGEQATPHDYRKGAASLGAVEARLRDAGLEIQRRLHRENHYVITARRP